MMDAIFIMFHLENNDLKHNKIVNALYLILIPFIKTLFITIILKEKQIGEKLFIHYRRYRNTLIFL